MNKMLECNKWERRLKHKNGNTNFTKYETSGGGYFDIAEEYVSKLFWFFISSLI